MTGRSLPAGDVVHQRIGDIALAGQPRNAAFLPVDNALQVSRDVSLRAHVYQSITDADAMQYPADVMFAKWFSEQLRWRDLSQAEFARRAGIPQSTVNTWVRGSRVPDPHNCDLIADALRMDIDVVLMQAGHRPDTPRTSPDDAKLLILGLVDRIDWSDNVNLQVALGVLRPLIERDGKKQ